MIEKIRNELIRLGVLEKMANEAEAAFESNPDSDILESVFDSTYKREFSCYIQVSRLIAEFSGMDEKTARWMVKNHRDKLLSILA